MVPLNPEEWEAAAAAQDAAQHELIDLAKREEYLALPFPFTPLALPTLAHCVCVILFVFFAFLCVHQG